MLVVSWDILVNVGVTRSVVDAALAHNICYVKLYALEFNGI